MLWGLKLQAQYSRSRTVKAQVMNLINDNCFQWMFNFPNTYMIEKSNKNENKEETIDQPSLLRINYKMKDD